MSDILENRCESDSCYRRCTGVSYVGVSVCLLGTSLKKTERLFAMMALYTESNSSGRNRWNPLAMGFACGDTVLTVAVLAIVLTVSLGAFAIDFSYKKLLKNQK